MKIMLIYPPITLTKGEGRYLCPPLGLGYLADSIRKRSAHEVVILDTVLEGYNTITPYHGRPDDISVYGITFPEIIDRIKAADPDLIGISCLFTHSARITADLARAIKESGVNVPVVAGGGAATALCRDFISDGFIDYVVLGEGEETFYRLLVELGNGSSDFSRIDGIAYRKNNQFVLNEKKSEIDNLDSLAVAYDLLPVERYLSSGNAHDSAEKKGSLPIMSSRGCPYKCVFCCQHKVWKKYRTRSAGNVLNEIEFLYNRYQARAFTFEDDNFTMNKKRVMDICRGIKSRKLDIEWSTPSGVAIWTLDEDLIDTMADAGLKSITFPFESGSEETIRKIGKPLDLKRAEELFYYCKAKGIFTRGFFIIGFPWETKEDIQKTVGLAERLSPDYFGFFIMTPHPGSPIYEDCVRSGVMTGKDPLDFRFNTGMIRTENFTPEFLESIRTKEWQRIMANKRGRRN